MASVTNRFRFTTFNSSTDRLDAQNYKFGDADRVLLDRLLRFAVEAHVHNGAIIQAVPPPPPSLQIDVAAGTIRPNTTVYYRYTIIDSRGQESLASNAISITTPAQIVAPQFAPRLTRNEGDLEGGDYLYSLSACTTTTSQETTCGPTVAGTLDGYSGWYLDLPPLPSGAEFFNIYRKGPRDDTLHYLASTADFEDRVFIDTGAVTSNRFRAAPSQNTTSLTNSIAVGLPYPPADTGSWTWKLYRTFDPTNWDYSLLAWNPAVSQFIDDGRPARPGIPPDVSGAVGGAPKIDLSREVTGALPPSSTAWIRTVNFNADYPVVGPATWSWLNEFEYIELIGMRAALGRGCAPTYGPLSIGLDRDTGAGWFPINTAGGTPIFCSIDAGDLISIPVTLQYADFIGFRVGHRLRLRIDQTDTAPVPTARDLTLTVTMKVRDSHTASYVWETT